MIRISLWLLLLFIIGNGLPVFAQVIPAERRVDWSNAGLRRTKPDHGNLRIITQYGGVGNGIAQNDLALQAAILTLGSDSGTIYFPPGNYYFTQAIHLRSGIVLRGADASLSTLSFNLGGSDHLVQIVGSITIDTAYVMQTAYKDSSTVTVDNSSLFQVGGYVKLYQNDTALINDLYALESVAQILQVKEINGNQIKFNSPFRRTYPLADQPRIKKLNMVSGTGIECLKIKRHDSATTIQKTANIYIDYAAQCWVTGVESDTANFAHVEIANSTNVAVTGSYFHNAFSFGPNGKGYGVSTDFSSGECLIENNIFNRLRHAIIFQSGANGNVTINNFSTNAHRSESTPNNLSGDIVLHGNYPYANMFEGNICENIIIDASHRFNGPYNTFFRNRATLYGIIMNQNAGDSTTFVGNEITAFGFIFGNYVLSGVGNFEYGNNRRGTIIPAGTTTLADSSYYYSSKPAYWDLPGNWPSIGIPNVLNTGTNPAKARFDAGINFTSCAPPFTYTFTGTGNWTNAANWQNLLPAPTTISSGMDVIIDHLTGGECIHTGTIQVQPGGKLTLKQGKKLTLEKD